MGGGGLRILKSRESGPREFFGAAKAVASRRFENDWRMFFGHAKGQAMMFCIGKMRGKRCFKCQ